MTQPHSVLVANRGEIAVRILRTAAERGLRTVAVYTPEDRDAAHVRLADEAQLLSGDGYRDSEQLVATGVAAGCTVVHPGYGFLSENADFAAACAKAGLTFAGPSPGLLRLFGDKARARRAAVEHGIPVLPATDGPTSLEQARAFAAPYLDGELPDGGGVLVKALAGGGGRGIRAVHAADGLAWAYERCRSEAARVFGDGEVCVERLLPRAKHIEVQVVGDGSGAVTHLWDRDCSVQRRYQKLVEVAPSPSLPDRIRARITALAVEFARGVRYEGLGTFEFLLGLGPDGAPDAAGLLQIDPGLDGERAGAVTSGRYDSLLAKVVAHAPRGGFGAAVARLDRALAEFTVAGPGTNTTLLRSVLAEPAFAAGSFSTRLVDDLLPRHRTAADGDPDGRTPDQDSGDDGDGAGGGVVRAHSSGTVVSVEAAAGDTVRAGQALVVLEAMKMEHVLTAPADGCVREMPAAVGDTVRAQDPLAVLALSGLPADAAPGRADGAWAATRT